MDLAGFEPAASRMPCERATVAPQALECAEPAGAFKVFLTANCGV